MKAVFLGCPGKRQYGVCLDGCTGFHFEGEETQFCKSLLDKIVEVVDDGGTVLCIKYRDVEYDIWVDMLRPLSPLEQLIEGL